MEDNVQPRPSEGASTLPFSADLWTDYDIDDKTLRAKAWGAYKTKSRVEIGLDEYRQGKYTTINERERT